MAVALSCEALAHFPRVTAVRVRAATRARALLLRCHQSACPISSPAKKSANASTHKEFVQRHLTVRA